MKALPNAVQNYLLYCEHERNYSPHTVKAYRLDLNGFTEFAASIKEKPFPSLDKLTKDSFRAYLQSLQSAKPRTIRRKIACLKSFFGYLHREGYIAENLIEGWKCDVRIGTSLPRTISRIAVGSILREACRRPKITRRNKNTNDAWKRTRTSALIEMLYGTGMRVGEVTSLLTTSIDLDAETIMVHGKGNRERKIPIVTPELKNSLRKWNCLRHERFPEAVHFFVNRSGEKLGEQSIRTIVRQIGGDTGGKPRITPHMFRHTLATQLLEEGADLRHIQRLLGHSSIATTTIYVQVSDMSQRKCLQAHHPRRRFRS